jgi:hypothetical protein
MNYTAMVFINDEGSEFKASMDKIWRYNQAETGHTHPSMQNLQKKKEGASMLFTFQVVSPNGSTENRLTRITPLSPVGSWIEELQGRFAGSKYINYYVPKGDKTEVRVVGEWTSDTIPQDKLKQAVLDHLKVIYEEDVQSLERFQ